MVSLPDNDLAAGSCVFSIGTPRIDEMPEKARTESAEVSEPSDEEEVSYPEGGLEAWLVVFGSFCGM